MSNANEAYTVGQDSETESTEHCPKYKQSTVTQIQLDNRPIVITSKTSSNRRPQQILC